MTSGSSIKINICLLTVLYKHGCVSGSLRELVKHPDLQGSHKTY